MPDEAGVRVLHLDDFRGRPGGGASLATVYTSPHSRARLLTAPQGSGLPAGASAESERVLLLLEGRARLLGVTGPDEAGIGALFHAAPGAAFGAQSLDAQAPTVALVYETPPVADEEEPQAAPAVGVQNPRASVVHEANPLALTGNAFVPLYESERSACALFHVEAGRRMHTGPESERTFLFLGGTGLVFLEEGTTVPIRAGDVAVLAPGYPARIWARGPEPLSGVVFQPVMERAERRSLRGELTRLKDELAKRQQERPGP